MLSAPLRKRSNEFVTSLNQATGCYGSGVWDLDQLFEVIGKLPPLKRQS
jgi:hypothetical protein